MVISPHHQRDGGAPPQPHSARGATDTADRWRRLAGRAGLAAPPLARGRGDSPTDLTLVQRRLTRRKQALYSTGTRVKGGRLWESGQDTSEDDDNQTAKEQR